MPAMNPYTTIAKPVLESLKASYSKDLANPRTSRAIRGTIQNELAQIDAALDQQSAQHPRSDLPAATERPGIKARPPASASRPLVSKWPKGVHSRGEFILMRAEQLQSQIKKVFETALPHTREIVPHLETFLAAQKELVDRERTERREAQQSPRSGLPAATKGTLTQHQRSGLPAATDPSTRSGPEQWSEAWRDQTSGSEPTASAWPKGWPRTVADKQISTPCPVCGPEREVCFIKRDGIRCVVLGQMGPSRWHPTGDDETAIP